MKITTILLLIIILLLGGLTVFLFLGNQENIPSQPSPTPSSTVLPSPSATPDQPGQTPVDSDAMILLENPQPLDTIASPLTITGQARGGWFFEADFPVVLTNWDGLIIAEGFATAEGDWMTEDFVPFSATLEFETPDFGERGHLILQRANPSGLPENDDALEIEIRYEIE